jgi:hypothetical protein
VHHTIELAYYSYMENQQRGSFCSCWNGLSG